MTGRWELLRVLGAVADTPLDTSASRALDLPVAEPADHTEVFALNCPPYASIHLGAEGGIAGEGADRVAGFWRTIGVSPPAEPDHLSALMALYACLGEAAEQAHRPATAAALRHMSRALLHEHLRPWVPGYLDAVTDLGVASLAAWAEVTAAALDAEYRFHDPAGGLPSALRDAPAGLDPENGVEDMLDALVSPVRSGVVLTRRSISRLADQAGLGYRIGERRFALRCMFEQDPVAASAVLGAEARRWSARHLQRPVADEGSRWWAKRAADTAAVLTATGAYSARQPAQV